MIEGKIINEKTKKLIIKKTFMYAYILLYYKLSVVSTTLIKQINSNANRYDQ